MRKTVLCVSALVLGTISMGGLHASSVKGTLYESPDAKEIIKKDSLPAATKFTMPKGCVTKNPKDIHLGKILFNDFGNKNHKFKEFPNKKSFGNCVACHNIEQADGHGNIGPDLTQYRQNFVASGARDHQWIFQKIADPRIDNEHTLMTINKTNNLLNDKEICQIISYIVADK
ncbi:MAG: sulfur oxidation c-type cytochrome SoxX [Sulfurimonas sp.]|jgi:sulfur-oxidizing protein SoxX|nr:sulfur oxidation c-type cytochrome SoxX [Sulfurimonas sp.]